MIVLSIDSAMNGCSVCVYDAQNDAVHAQRDTAMVRGQAEALMPMVNDVLSDADMTFQDLNLIAVTQGPGAFTGMRIGLATAKSIGMVVGVPVVGVGCFDAIMRTYGANKDHFDVSGPVIVLLETKRKDFYVQVYASGDAQKVDDPSVMMCHEIDALSESDEALFIGDGITRYQKETTKTVKTHFIEKPLASEVARLGVEVYNQSPEKVSSDPVYLRMPEIGKPKNPPRKLEQ